jgi:hypothetical protein
MSGSEDEVAQAEPETEETPVEVGDDFCDYVSVKSPPERSRPLKPAAKGTFGILDFPRDSIGTVPCFTEPETVEAMRRLGYVPEDLTQAAGLGLDTQNGEVREKVMGELEHRRMELISNVIEERNKIIQGEPVPNRRRKKRRKTQKKTPVWKEVVDEKVKKLAEQKSEKRREELEKLTQRKKVVAELLKSREKKACLALERGESAEKRQAKMLADKQAALRQKEKEKNARARAVREAGATPEKSEKRQTTKPKRKISKSRGS